MVLGSPFLYQVSILTHVAMAHNLWLHFGVDEHPFASYFDVDQGYRVLTHSHMKAFSVFVLERERERD